MNLYNSFLKDIKESIQSIEIEGFIGADLSRINVEPPRESGHGDLATNAAMVLAKQVGSAPREVAEILTDRFAAIESIQSAEIAGPGFINLRLTDRFWTEQLRAIVAKGTAYGGDQVAQVERVNVEYVSANPTGPMHVGHCRGAVVGDALANLLAFVGHDVTKEYYTNDAGAQIDVLANSVFLRYREALGEAIGEIPPGLYPGDYLIPVGQALAEQHGSDLLAMEERQRNALVREAAIAAMMALIREDLAALNVHHDVFFSEQSLHKVHANQSKIAEGLEDLRSKGFVYEGRLPPPKGEVPEDWEDREQTLFRSTEVGDDIDRPLMKSDGTYTYFAADVAYFKDKYDRGFNRTIFVLGADHGGYVKRLKAVAEAVSGGSVSLQVLLCQLVKLFQNGEPVRMSKRSGDFVTLRDVVDEVGKDAVRFMMLYRKAEAPLDFDFAKVTEQSKDNPVFYVQYAHARTCSVFRQAVLEMPTLEVTDEALQSAEYARLVDASEQALIKKMTEYPRMLEQAARACEPHRIAFYLYELASDFHSHWNRGKDQPDLRFINHNEPELTRARLGLVRAISSLLASGLAILGASAPEEMR